MKLNVEKSGEASGTIYVSGVDVVDGSAVLETQALLIKNQALFWIAACLEVVQLLHSCFQLLCLNARLDIKPYHPVESFGCQPDVQCHERVDAEAHPVF